MIKHYFCEYCGKDFLSEDECVKHEENCEEKLKELEKRREADRQADLEKIAVYFNELVELCTNYIEKYGISDLDKFKKTIESKLFLNGKRFDSKKDITNKSDSKSLSSLGPWEFTLKDVKYNDKDLNKILGIDNLHPFGRMAINSLKNKDDKKDKKNEDRKDEIDDIIDKLSDASTMELNPVTTVKMTDEDFQKAFEKFLSTLDEYNF